MTDRIFRLSLHKAIVHGFINGSGFGVSIIIFLSILESNSPLSFNDYYVVIVFIIYISITVCCVALFQQKFIVTEQGVFHQNFYFKKQFIKWENISKVVGLDESSNAEKYITILKSHRIIGESESVEIYQKYFDNYEELIQAIQNKIPEKCEIGKTELINLEQQRKFSIYYQVLAVLLIGFSVVQLTLNLSYDYVHISLFTDFRKINLYLIILCVVSLFLIHTVFRKSNITKNHPVLFSAGFLFLPLLIFSTWQGGTRVYNSYLVNNQQLSIVPVYLKLTSQSRSKTYQEWKLISVNNKRNKKILKLMIGKESIET